MDKNKNEHYVLRMYIKRFGYRTEKNKDIRINEK